MEIEKFNDHKLKALAKKLAAELIFLFDECRVEFDSANIFKSKVYELAIDFYNCVLLGFTTYNSKLFESEIYNEDTLITQLKESKSILVKIFGCLELAKEEGIKFSNKSTSERIVLNLIDEYERLLKEYQL